MQKLNGETNKPASEVGLSGYGAHSGILDSNFFDDNSAKKYADAFNSINGDSAGVDE